MAQRAIRLPSRNAKVLRYLIGPYRAVLSDESEHVTGQRAGASACRAGVHWFQPINSKREFVFCTNHISHFTLNEF
ncbi:hypothetical protein M0678_11585 [Mycobacterium colombiense]|nr:hypothetical protein [Mycobacterium colombiense]